MTTTTPKGIRIPEDSDFYSDGAEQMRNIGNDVDNLLTGYKEKAPNNLGSSFHIDVTTSDPIGAETVVSSLSFTGVEATTYAFVYAGWKSITPTANAKITVRLRNGGITGTVVQEWVQQGVAGVEDHGGSLLVPVAIPDGDSTVTLTLQASSGIAEMNASGTAPTTIVVIPR